MGLARERRSCSGECGIHRPTAANQTCKTQETFPWLYIRRQCSGGQTGGTDCRLSRKLQLHNFYVITHTQSRLFREQLAKSHHVPFRASAYPSVHQTRQGKPFLWSVITLPLFVVNSHFLCFPMGKKLHTRVHLITTTKFLEVGNL